MIRRLVNTLKGDRTWFRRGKFDCVAFRGARGTSPTGGIDYTDRRPRLGRTALWETPCHEDSPFHRDGLMIA
jgi:hypothetical protein